MTEIFNKYGAMKNETVEKASSEILILSTKMFEELYHKHTLSEIRSYSFYLIISIIEAKKKYYWENEIEEDFYGMIGDEEIENTCFTVFNSTKELFKELNIGHFNINGVASYLISTVDCALAEFILKRAMEMRKGEKNEAKINSSS